ncbi:hypothetical protein J6590_005259 [Homalodisca vitripennis]|nr:hypothetical protein J6590_005259 [Homalodisca vitripennis]
MVYLKATTWWLANTPVSIMHTNGVQIDSATTTTTTITTTMLMERGREEGGRNSCKWISMIKSIVTMWCATKSLPGVLGLGYSTLIRITTHNSLEIQHDGIILLPSEQWCHCSGDKFPLRPRGGESTIPTLPHAYQPNLASTRDKSCIGGLWPAAGSDICVSVYNAGGLRANCV